MKKSRILAAVILFALILTIAYPVSTVAAFSDNIKAETVPELVPELVIETTPTTTETVVIIINDDEITKAKVPTYTKIAKCNVNLHLSPNNEDYSGALVLNRGTKVEGKFYEDTKWFEIEKNGTKYYIYSDYLVTEDEWAELSKIPYSTEVLLPEDVQKYLYEECQDLDIKYCFALAVMDVETGGTFRNDLISKTNDWGCMQVNKCWHKTFKKMGYITCSEDLLNYYNGIHCGLWILSQYTSQFGSVERSYAAYNTGNTAIKSNKNSREVMRRYEKWKTILGDI